MKKGLMILFAVLVSSHTALAARPDERYDKGFRLLNSQRYLEAAAAFKTITDRDPTDGEAWFQMGQAYYGAGRCQDGLTAYDEALHLQPGKAAYWSGKGNSLLCLGRSDDALKSFDRALALDNRLGTAWYGAARCYALKVEKEAALKHLSHAIELNAYFKDMAYRDRSFRNWSNEKEFHRLIEP